MKILILLIFLPVITFSQIIEYRNANVYNGNDFELRTFYSVDSKLFLQQPDNVLIDSIVDLKLGYIIPPFAEAHNHNLESTYQLQERIDSYIQDGVFYIKMQSSIKKRIEPLMHLYNHHGSLDVSVAHAPITGTDGHPIGVRKWYLEKGYFDEMFQTLEEIESHGYFVVDSKSQLKLKWPAIIEKKPDFIKVMLLCSEEYEKRKNDTTYFGNKGLNPELLPNLVELAHNYGYRVTAHVSTVHDFSVAINSGVDEIAHLPGYREGGLIKEEDAVLAATNGTVVITTASLALKQKESEGYKQLLEDIKKNLVLLKKHGVTIAIGSDMYNDTSIGEVEFLRGLNVFSNSELLAMWCTNAAKTIFPNRKLGELKDGFEPAFLF